MPTKFTREIYRRGYLKARSQYKETSPPNHPWNEMVVRIKARDRSMWFAAWKWEQVQ